jgi:xanthine dehydrogenase small subunit
MLSGMTRSVPPETAAPRASIRFGHRGRVVELSGFSPRRTLLDWLREDQRLTGTKEGCAEGDCGACTVVLRRLRQGRLVHEPVNACILLLGQVDGADLVTVEDLAPGGDLHPVQAAMVEHHGSQCGFCTPGIVMSLYALHEDAERPLERGQVCDALAGNLCRCTGYRPIIEASLAASALPPTARPDAGEAVARLERLGADAGRDLFVGTDERFFAAPASLASLVDLLARHPGALLVAGATDVGLWITKGLQDPRRIIWLGRVAGLDRLEEHPDRLVIGAGVTHAGAFAALAGLDPDLGEVMRRFGSAQVRASGTVGGNIANGSPIGDLAPCLIALGATLHLAGPAGARRLQLERFFLAYRRQDRAADEVVTAIEVPRPAAGQHIRAFKVSKRFDEDISAVMGAFLVTLDGGRVRAARVAFGGMAGTPKRAETVETRLVGARLDDEATWEPALAAMGEDFQPLSDQRASAAYRLEVARNLLRKALLELGGAGGTRLVGHRAGAEARA